MSMEYQSHQITRREAEYFAAKIDTSGDCWLWTAHRNRDGYGTFRLGEKRSIGAHRVAWTLMRGPIPDGMHVLHDCPGRDNPSCVNPDHLWLGTHLENHQDRSRKGRAVSLKGGANPNAKLTEADVRAIRATPITRGVVSELARRYGVGRTQIYRVIDREWWRHVA